MSNQNKNEAVITELKQKVQELTEFLGKKMYNNTLRFNYYFSKWKSETEYIIRKNFSDDSIQLAKFLEVSDLSKWDHTTGTPTQFASRRQRMMLRSAAELETIISSIEKYGLPEKSEVIIPAKVFIAHGGKTKALDKVQAFLIALNVIPLIAEEEPSVDRSANQQVEWCLDNSDCAIILGTADDKDLKDGKLYPRRNVHIEIGRVQERFPNKVIYLLEEGASFPSNISEKVYERFTRENMENAYIKIAKELRAFGIIVTQSIRKQSV